MLAFASLAIAHPKMQVSDNLVLDLPSPSPTLELEFHDEDDLEALPQLLRRDTRKTTIEELMTFLRNGVVK